MSLKAIASELKASGVGYRVVTASSVSITTSKPSDYKATAKPVSKGAKFEHTVTLNGDVVDKRTSTHQYGVVVVGTPVKSTESVIRSAIQEDIAECESYISKITQAKEHGRPSIKILKPGYNNAVPVSQKDYDSEISRVRGVIEKMKTDPQRLRNMIDHPFVIGWSRDNATGAKLGRDYEKKGYAVYCIPCEHS